MLKGYKTLILNAAVALLGVAQGFDWVGVAGGEKAGWVMTGIGIANMILRSLTNTPVGKAE